MLLARWPARLYAIALVVAVALCGALSIEAWPLTGWRLFATERRPIAHGWMATSVDARGHETEIPFDRFPAADRHLTSVMWTYAARTPAEQEATCVAWARLVRRYGGSAERGLRLYSTTRDMRRHVGRHEPVQAIAKLRWTCADGHGARAADAGAKRRAGTAATPNPGRTGGSAAATPNPGRTGGSAAATPNPGRTGGSAAATPDPGRAGGGSA
jgi:hypothetical protein